jgi:hypothetical protein
MNGGDAGAINRGFPFSFSHPFSQISAERISINRHRKENENE